MRILAVVIAVLLLLAFASSFWLTRPVVSGPDENELMRAISIAPAHEALTLAREVTGAVLLVTDADASGVTAVELVVPGDTVDSDALAAYNILGREGVETQAVAGNTRQVAWEELGAPLDGAYPHIAAGTNYRAHAEEVGHDGEPFLFPKRSRVTPWNGAVPQVARLDYEVELCVVPLTGHTADRPAELGFMLCGDFTDRWALVRHIDLEGEMGLTGFPIAKGGAGKLPIGPLLVIPQDPDFYQQIQLSLYLNGTLRQHDSAGRMVWSPKEILDRALAACEASYQLGEGTTRLVDCHAVPAGTVVLTGTPEGVLFKPATIWNPWAYLRRGDVVSSYGTYLGMMQNVVVD